MQSKVLKKIEELSEERERILSREPRHATPADHARLQEIEHSLEVLWDLRRRELAGEDIDLDEDFYDQYDRYT